MGPLLTTTPVTATDGNGHSVTQSQTICFSPYGVTNGIFGGVYNTDATSAVITWSGPASTIASEYIIQRISPGEEADGWQTIGYRLVSDNISSDEDGLNYTYTDSNLSPSSIGGDGGYLYRIGAKTGDATSDAPGSPGVAGYTVATTLYQTPLPSGPGNLSGVDTSIVAGGEVDVVLSYGLHSGDNPAGTVITVKNYNPDVVQPTVTTVTINSSGGAILPVKGLSVGSGKLIVQDSAGDEGVINCGVTAVGISSTGNVVQGATYGSSNMPGFTFFIDGPSATPVVISYNTSGSTLPSDLMGNMSGGSVTIDPGSQSVFVPFTVPDDGKIAPMRTVVVTLTPAEGGDLAYMNVQNTDLPGITIDGEQDGADVTLDPEDENSTSLLAPVAFTINKDGSLNSATLTWDPSQDVIWLTDQVGTVGVDDLASMPGVVSDAYGDHYTWTGIVPTKVWAQAIGGSSVTDGTSLTLQATVSKLATSFVSAVVASLSGAAAATQAGIWIDVSGADVVPDSDPTVAGDTVVGAGVTVSVGYLGPDPVGLALSDVDWSIQGANSSPEAATAVAGYNVSTGIGAVKVLTPTALRQSSVHFYFLPNSGLVDVRSISVDASLGGSAGYHASANVRVITPASTFIGVPTALKPAVNIVYNNYAAAYALSLGDSGGAFENAGIGFRGSVTAPSLVGGKAFVLQLVSDHSVEFAPGKIIVDDEVSALDNPPRNRVVPLYGQTVLTPAGAQTALFFPHGLRIIDDSPDIKLVVPDYLVSRTFSAATYEMWQPALTDSVPVPLRMLNWSFSGEARSSNVVGLPGEWTLASSSCSFDNLAPGANVQSAVFCAPPQWTQFAADSVPKTFP